MTQFKEEIKKLIESIAMISHIEKHRFPTPDEFATELADRIEVDKEATIKILLECCDTDSEEAVMYSEAQAEALSKSPILRVRGDGK